MSTQPNNAQSPDTNISRQTHPPGPKCAGGTGSRLRSSLRERGRELSRAALPQEGVERIPIPVIGVPPWHGQRRWKCEPDLVDGGSNKDEAEALKAETLRTILTRFPNRGVTIYTDGSAEEGFRHGGSAAVVTRGDPTNPEVVEVRRAKGRAVTCSYETELVALKLAVGWINDNQVDEEVVICTDSRAATVSLTGADIKSMDALDVVNALEASTLDRAGDPAMGPRPRGAPGE